MEQFFIDPIIKEQFEYYQNMCSLLSEFIESKFAPPATLEEIEHWEKENNATLPHQYKSWLMLTKESRILDGYIEFRWPELGCLDTDDDVIIIGSVIGDGEELLISRESNHILSFFDGETEEYNDFDDCLTTKSCYIESMAEDFIGEEWTDLYDEKFPSQP